MTTIKDSVQVRAGTRVEEGMGVLHWAADMTTIKDSVQVRAGMRVEEGMGVFCKRGLGVLDGDE
jgi:hypothetical protein